MQQKFLTSTVKSDQSSHIDEGAPPKPIDTLPKGDFNQNKQSEQPATSTEQKKGIFEEDISEILEEVKGDDDIIEEDLVFAEQNESLNRMQHPVHSEDEHVANQSSTFQDYQKKLDESLQRQFGLGSKAENNENSEEKMKEYEERLQKYLEEHSRSKKRELGEEKARINQNFEEDLKHMKQQIDIEFEYDEEKEFMEEEQDKLRSLLQKECEESFLKKRQELIDRFEMRQLPSQQNLLQQEQRETTKTSLELEKQIQELRRERDFLLKKKIKVSAEKSFLPKDWSRSQNIELDQFKIEIKMQSSRRLALFEQEFAELQNKLLFQFKKDLNSRFDLERSLISAGDYGAGEEFIQRKQEVKAMYDDKLDKEKARLIKEADHYNRILEGEVDIAIDRLRHMEPRSQKVQELLHNKDTLEVDKMVYEQKLKRELQSLRNNLECQIEMEKQKLEAEKFDKFDAVERELAHLGRLLDQRAPSNKILLNTIEEIKSNERDNTLKSKKIIELLSETAEIERKIADARAALDDVLMQLASKKQEDEMKRTALASVENLNQDLEKKNQEIAYFIKSRAASLAENSVAQQNESFSNQPNQSVFLILKELEDIKDTLKSTLREQTPKQQQQLPIKTVKRNHRIQALEKTIQELTNEIEQNSEEDPNQKTIYEKEKFSSPGSAKMLSSPSNSVLKEGFTFSDFKKLVSLNGKKTSKPVRKIDLFSRSSPERFSKASEMYSPEKNNKLKIWLTILEEEQSALESMQAGILKRKAKLKEHQEEIKSEQEKYKNELSFYKSRPQPSRSRKLKLIFLKKHLNERTRAYNAELKRVRADEARLKEKEELHREMQRMIDLGDVQPSLGERTLEKLYLRYKQLRIGYSIERTGEIELLEAIEETSADLISYQKTKKKKYAKSSFSEGISAAPADDKLDISHSDSDGMAENEEEEEDDAALTDDLYTKPRSHSRNKHKKEENPALNPMVLKHLRKNINPDNSVGRAWIVAMESEIRNERRFKLYDNLVSKYSSKI